MIRVILLSIFGLGILLCLIGAAINLKNYRTIEHHRTLLDQHGVITEATVFKKEKHHKKSKSIVGKSTVARNRYSSNYLLHLRYDANANKGTLSFTKARRGEKQDFDLSVNKKTLSLAVGESTYQHIELGDKRTIKYLPPDANLPNKRPSTMIVESLNDNGEYHANYRLFYAIALLLLAGLCAQLMRQYYTTGTTW